MGDEGIGLTEDDLEVYESEQPFIVRDRTHDRREHSMILYGEDRITPAKQAALALSD